MKLTRSKVVNKLTSIEDMKIRKVKVDGRKLDKIFFCGEPVGVLYTDCMTLSYDIDSEPQDMISIEFDDENSSGTLDNVLSDLIDSKDWAERLERQERVKNIREYFQARIAV